MKKLAFGGKAIVEGEGALEYLINIDAKRVMIITGGQSMIKNGVIDKIEKIFNKNGCETCLISGIQKNPDTEQVASGVEKMKEFKPDTVVAVGGGSPMDASKTMILMYENENINFDNILSVELPSERKIVKFIAIPSTSGTGSEVTKASVITFKKDNIKIGIKTNAFIPDLAILDPNITMSMPDNVVAETGMDAITHAVECYINNNLDDFTECIAKGAVEGLFKYLPISYKNKTLEARGKVHNYQCIAGLAFDNVGLGMAHGISHALGGKFNIGHGIANAIVLPYVLKYNSKDELVKRKLETLAKVIESDDFTESVKEIDGILNIPRCLKDAGISEDEFKNSLDILAENSLKGSTRVNPVKISKDQMEKMLNCIYYGNEIDF
ncbi:iron-containing alcohol dehydrogenase [Clostridiaceae bacterium UIB06]|uniref:Iron-containing alcohol dehydrogenase n=1 Tax=Clostridium thailandense TaxID=2794346 RepID=A0A949WSA4_9CLOT|nr:iron-containing alcohol dehydrogenase [Clostridium thailandense]MBV7274866.1 iron-containing alcohol dehydrogenase [Clostridium thailandense]MCH5137611.1 iron-containing alcohol dehydrogenase [Clostridiaceae bacterium UIB06]